jgi:hypothetical protein
MIDRMKSQHMMTSPRPASNRPHESWGRLIGTLLLLLAVLGIVLYGTIVVSVALGAIKEYDSLEREARMYEEEKG